jgi:hypothetical protein
MEMARQAGQVSGDGTAGCAGHSEKAQSNHLDATLERFTIEIVYPGQT